MESAVINVTTHSDAVVIRLRKPYLCTCGKLLDLDKDDLRLHAILQEGKVIEVELNCSPECAQYEGHIA